MYLSDKDIEALLADMNFETPNEGPRFDAKTQIQPCSIDLHLGAVIWRPKRLRRVLDFRKSELLQAEPRWIYKQVTLRTNNYITLKPGELVLARTHERFTVPAGFAGYLTGRSSFARLGLMINCTGGFINPGWRGHMTLQLVNLGSSIIRLFPYLPVCQLCVIQLTQPSKRNYGDEDLHSKYLDDDGGPSYWWKDKRIRELQAAVRKRSVSLEIEERLVERIKGCDPSVIRRLSDYLDRLPADALTDAESVLTEFSKSEKSRRWKRALVHHAGLGAFWFVAGAFVAVLLAPSPPLPPTPLAVKYTLGVAAALTLAWFVHSAVTDVGEYLTPKALQKSES